MITEDLQFSRDGKKPLTGVFYVGVYGETDAYYTITPIVTRRIEEEEMINYITLSEGTAFKYKLSSE